MCGPMQCTRLSSGAIISEPSIMSYSAVAVGLNVRNQALCGCRRRLPKCFRSRSVFWSVPVRGYFSCWCRSQWESERRSSCHAMLRYEMWSAAAAAAAFGGAITATPINVICCLSSLAGVHLVKDSHEIRWGSFSCCLLYVQRVDFSGPQTISDRPTALR